MSLSTSSASDTTMVVRAVPCDAIVAAKFGINLSTTASSETTISLKRRPKVDLSTLTTEQQKEHRNLIARESARKRKLEEKQEAIQAKDDRFLEDAIAGMDKPHEERHQKILDLIAQNRNNRLHHEREHFHLNNDIILLRDQLEDNLDPLDDNWNIYTLEQKQNYIIRLIKQMQDGDYQLRPSAALIDKEADQIEVQMVRQAEVPPHLAAVHQR